MNMLEKFAKMIEVGVNKMAANEEAVPASVIEVTGTARLRPDHCSPDRAFLESWYCDPYFGWLQPALEEAIVLLETAEMSEDLAIRLWQNGWSRAFLVELFERNNEEWSSNDGEELYDRLPFKVRTRKGFVEWLLSGERLYGYNLPGHESILETKEALLLRNRKAKSQTKKKDEVI